MKRIKLKYTYQVGFPNRIEPPSFAPAARLMFRLKFDALTVAYVAATQEAHQAPDYEWVACSAAYESAEPAIEYELGWAFETAFIPATSGVNV